MLCPLNPKLDKKQLGKDMMHPTEFLSNHNKLEGTSRRFYCEFQSL